jgi:polyisoprenoid-binding protein YceI
MAQRRLASAVAVLAGTSPAVPAVPAVAQETDAFDEGHTEIRFSWNHAGITTQSAEFAAVGGEVVIDRDESAHSRVDVTIDAASIETGVEAFNEHITWSEVFAVAAPGAITVASTAVPRVVQDRALITGDLTIKGITHPVTLDAVSTSDGQHPLGAFMDEYDAYYTGFEATATVRRSRWELGMFAPLVADAVDLTIRTELRRLDEAS